MRFHSISNHVWKKMTRDVTVYRFLKKILKKRNKKFFPGNRTDICSCFYHAGKKKGSNKID